MRPLRAVGTVPVRPVRQARCPAVSRWSSRFRTRRSFRPPDGCGSSRTEDSRTSAWTISGK
eukprot:4965830-Pleurochrysis_carterae.AAC.1